MINKLKQHIAAVPNFPIEGITFRDMSPLLASPHWKDVIRQLADLVEPPKYWVGIEARGFLFASALAAIQGSGVIMCRKVGKLPPPTINYKYQTEYSTDELTIKEGSGKVVIVDDVLATGGTIQAANHLCDIAGYEVIDNLVLIDLLTIPRVSDFDINVKSLIQYE